MNKILLLFISFLVFGNGQVIAHNTGKNKTDQKVDNLVVDQWNVFEITLNSKKAYTDPFNQVDVYAVFSGPGGKIITRPAFWDGGKIWKIRFAPTLTGEWKMVTSCSNVADRGLHKISRSIMCKPYSGTLDIYKHGFLKVSEDRRYFVHDDGTPFFYLGDTHWLYIHERFDTSNVKGIPSQFKYVVDKRVGQGFTVYQTEAIQHPHGHDPERGRRYK